MSSSTSFAGAKCLVVGATDHKSIGYTCALNLVKAGARVCIMGRDETMVQLAVKDLEAAVPVVGVATCAPMEACGFNDPVTQPDTIGEVFGAAVTGCLNTSFHLDRHDDNDEDRVINGEDDNESTTTGSNTMIPSSIMVTPQRRGAKKEKKPTSSARHRRPATFVTGIVGDLWKPEVMEVLMNRAVETCLNGGLDILIISAGNGVEYTELDPTDKFSYTLSMNVAVLSPQFLVDAAAPYLSKSTRPGGGAVVMVGSLSSIIPQPLPEMAPYNYARAAQNCMIETLAFRHRLDNIRVNGVLPSCIYTGALDTMAARRGMSVEEYGQLRAKEHPTEKVGTPEQVAGAVLYLAGSGASYVTGELIKVDGGLHLSNWLNHPKNKEEEEEEQLDSCKNEKGLFSWIYHPAKEADDGPPEETTKEEKEVHPAKSRGMRMEDFVGPEVSKSIDELVVSTSDSFVKLVDDVAKAVEDISPKKTGKGI